MASSALIMIGLLIAGLVIGYGVAIFQGPSAPFTTSEPRAPENTVTITGSVTVAGGEYIPSRVDFQSSNVSSSAIVTRVAGNGTPSEPYTGEYSIYLPSGRLASYEITIAFIGTSKLLETCEAGFIYLTMDRSNPELNLIC